MEQKIDMKQDRENQKFWDNWLKQEQSLVVGNAPVVNKEVKEQVAEKLGLHKRSITPTTLDQVVFDKNPDEDQLYVEIYKYKNNIVFRFGINDSVNHKIPLNFSDKSGSTRSTNKIQEAQKKIDPLIENHPLEIILINKALDYLMSGDNRTVLLDIFARQDGAIKTDKNGIPEIHTVVLYKNPSMEEKHNVMVIDPSNFLFSSYLSNDNTRSNIKNEKLNKIITDCKLYQLYKPFDKTNVGGSDDNFRDCIDISVKLSFLLNKLPETSEIRIKDINDLKIFARISNNQIINDSILDTIYQEKFLPIPFRVLQRSDLKISELFNDFSKNFKVKRLKISEKTKKQDMDNFYYSHVSKPNTSDEYLLEGVKKIVLEVNSLLKIQYSNQIMELSQGIIDLEIESQKISDIDLSGDVNY